LTGLVKKIDERMQAVQSKPPRAPGVYFIVDSNAEGLDKQLRTIACSESLQHINLCIGPVPQDYVISKDAEVTVVIYNMNRRGDQRVTANFALRKGELNDAKADAIVKALADVLPK
jgi:hypothetical protein